MRQRGSFSGPLVLILIGAALLLRTLSPGFRFGELLAHYWPYVLILWGVVACIEVCFRFLTNAPIPKNGASGGGWVFVALLVLLGSSAFEFDRPGNWLKQIGFENGMEALGEEHHYTLSPQRQATGAAPRIVIEDFRGDAKVTGGDASEVSLTGRQTIRSFDSRDADKAHTQTPVEMVQSGNTLTIRCHQERVEARSSIATNLELNVPKGASVELAASHGAVDISTLAGDVHFSGGSSAQIKLDDIGGDIKLDTRGAESIHCTNVKGAIDLHGRGADVSLEKVAGKVTIAGDYTGTVSLREVANPVRLESMRTHLDAIRIPGFVRLERGSLQGQNLIGPIKLSAHSTDVTLSGFSDDLDLTLDRGDIELRPRHASVGRMAVHTRSGDIELAVPAEAAFALTANTNNGEIDNQFGGGLTLTSQGRGSKLEGSVGSGPDLKLATQHGTITVRKAGKDDTAASVPVARLQLIHSLGGGAALAFLSSSSN